MSKHALRIAVVAACPFPAPRGTPIRILRLAEALAHRGHDVSVVTYHLGDRAADLPFQVHRIARVPAYVKTSPGPSVRKIVQLDPMLALKLKSVIDAEPVDVIHAHHYEGLLASSWARPPCPIVYDAHTTLGSELPAYGRVLPNAAKRWAGGLLDWGLPRRAAHTVAVTPSIRDYLVNIGAVVNENVTVIGNGVELANFEHCDDTHNLDEQNCKVLAYAGNLAPYQRVDLMLEAFACLRRLRQDVRLLIVTDSPFDGYTELADKLGVRDYLDVVSRPFAELPTSLAKAHVVINPRLECAGIPQKLLNYMAAAKPVVSFEGSAVCLRDGETGFRVEDGNVQAMADAANRLLNDAALAARIGNAAREQVREEFSWERAAIATERVYDRVLQ